MTSIEWFFNELERMQYFIGNDLYQAYNEAKEMHKQEMVSISNQQEISDEEIEKHMRTHSPYPLGKQGDIDWKNGFYRGIEWYREQLKQRQ